MTPFYGLEITHSWLLPKGMIMWMRGSEVLGWVSEDRQHFWRRFGFVANAPAGCTGIKVSTVDYEIMTQDLAEHEAFSSTITLEK